MSKLENKHECPHVGGVVQNCLCCFCGTCQSICPSGAITIDYNGSFPVPIVDESLCTRCGLCLKICPGKSVEMVDLTRTFLHHDYDNPLTGFYLNCFTGAVRDELSRLNRTSGGLAKEIACWGLRQGLWGAVAMSRFSDEGFCRTETVLVSDTEQVLDASGSLYCPVTAGTVIEQIKQARTTVCFIGLPCHIHALRKAQKVLPWLREKVAFTIGLFCSGTPGVDATRCFLRSHRIRPEDVRSLVYRSEGWPGDIEVRLKNEEKPLRFPRGRANNFINHLKFATAFHHGGAFFHPRCSVCPDYFAELADVSLGDAWNLNLDASRGGWNVGLTRTAKAGQILEEMKKYQRIEYCSLPIERLIQSHLDCIEMKKNLMPVLVVYERLGYQKPFFEGQPEGSSHFLLVLLYRLRWFQKKLARHSAAWSFLWILTLLEGVLKKGGNRICSRKGSCTFVSRSD